MRDPPPRSKLFARNFIWLCAAVWVGVFAVEDNAAAAKLDADQLARLRAGDAIVRVSEDEAGEADGRIEAAIEIPAAPDKIFAVMLDCQRALRFLAGLTACRVLETSKDGRSDVREHRSKWLSILPETVSVFRSDYVPGREIRFEKVRGDLRFLKGSWRLEPLKGGAATRVFYDVRVGISTPIPGFMIRGALEQDVPKLLRALRGEVLSGG